MMKRLYVYMLIVLEILVADNVYSQTTFGPQQVIVQSETASATSVYAADLDGDGDLDILSASQDDNKIAWYENDGSGNFGTQKIISVAAHRAHAVYAADLDGDGDTDVLSASWSDNKIAWYENDGAGNFGAQQIITTTAGGARSVYASDLDGDGDMDVLSASSQDDKIAWYENDGAGGFGTQQIISTTADYAISVYAADLDSDGDMDVLSASQNDNKIAWYENDGAGNFGAQQIISTVADGARSVYAADLDGDGDIDVLSASFNDDKLAWYENDGFGNFGIQQIIFNSPGYPQGIYAAYAADLDGDGDLDIISTALSEKKIAWQENDGTGNFGQQQIISTSAHTPISVYAADVDGDGDMDVLSASQYDDKIAWYENDGNGIFGIQQLISISATTSARSVYTADLDGDGDLDVLSASYWDNKIAWYENDGTGNFGTQQIISTAADYALSVYAADLDGDGDIDVLSASESDDKIAWYENDGAGNFGTQQIISIAANGARSVYAADLDGDGDLDVLSASSDDKIAWYENDGAGNFGTQQIISLATDNPIFVYAIDLDGDGDLDVLSASYWDNKIAWYENDGTGNFDTQQIITISAINATAVYAADLDGDGDADVLSASSQDDKIAWYENDGAGNFGAQQIITTAANGARSVYAADIDGDGNLDVLSASQFDDKIAWYENDGLGNFGVQQIISLVANGAWSVYAADLDGDGDMDLLSASIADDKIAWYENLLYSPSVSDPLPPIAAFTTLPTPNATTTDTLIVCQGQPVQFLNQSENANAFMWEFGNGTTSTTANPSYTYPEPGTYEVTLTAYSNFPQPDVCEADAGEWVWGNVVGYTQNPDYVNIVVVSYENTVVQTFMMPLSLVDQQTIVNYYYQGIFNGAFYSVYSISYKPEEENPVIDFFNISSCMDIDTLTFCGYLQENVTTYLDEITGVYNTEIEVCKIPPVITYLKLTASDDSGVVVTDYGIFDNNCFAITIPNTQPGEVYELLIQECFNSICTDFFPSFICDTFITIPDTSPRPAQKDGESTASMVIVIEPGFAPQISCVATVCQGTIADYSTDADCETYLWEVSGGQILSGQGTPAISVEWTTPPLGSISLSAGCGEETCNQPTVAAVPVIGGTVTIEGQSNFCLNETLQYTAPYFGGTAYQWSIVPPSAGTILSGQGGNLITVQWGASAATLQLNYQNNLLNCGGSASLAVQPKPAFALNPVSPVCEGNSMSISANSMASFVWSVSGGEIISGQNSSQILLLCSASGSMTVSATPVNPNTFCNASAQTSFTVVPYPQTPATINGSTQICPLQTYTYSAAPLQPNTQFIWTVTGGTIIAGQNSPTVQVQWNDSVPNSLSVVRQTLTSPVCTSLPATLSVSTIDDATFTISGATTVCPNSQPTYLITPILPNATYTWSVIPSDEVELVQGQNSGTVSLLFGNSAAGTVTLSAAYCNIVATLPISIGAKPVPFIIQTDTLCTGNSVQLSVSDLVGTEPYTGYLWKNSAGSAIGINPTTFITTEGVYSVQVTNTSGCVGLASHRVNQYTSPEAQAFVSSHVVCIQNPDDVDLIAIDGTNYAFMWMVNGSVISSAITPFLTHLGNDVEGSFVYRVLVTDTQNTCTKLSPPQNINHLLCQTGGGTGNPGDTIVPPPPPLQCPSVAGYFFNFTLTSGANNCNTVTLNASASGSFSSFTVNWGDGVTEAFDGVSAIHTYPVGLIMAYQITAYANYIHPVTGNSCTLGRIKNHILPLVARFDVEPACVGENWVFQCRSYYLPTTGITQWTWDFGDGTPPFTGTQTEGHTYANPGVYTATLTITNGDCVTTGSKTITVAPLPNAGFTISGGECVGSSLQFLPDVPNLSSYFWQLGNGASTAQHNPAFAYTQAGEYQVSLQVQDNIGCSSDIQTQTLIVLDAPPTQSVTAADTIFCAGLSTTLTAPPDGVAYLWSNGQTTPEINVSTSGNYTVQVTLPDGCAYTSPLVQVQVTPNPTADISPTSPINFCIGDSVTLQVPFNENYIYQWSENNNGQAQNTYNLSGNIGVTVTDTLTGCTAIGTAQLIDNASPPKPIITASALQICEGQSVNFSIASSTDPLHTYHWTTGATGTGISVFTSGNYGVWAQNQFGCSSDTSLLLNVVVNPLPDAGIFPAGCYALCPGDVVSIPPNTAQNYQWYYNGNPLSGITGSSWIPEAEGAYWVVMNNGNCTVTSDVLQLEFIADCPGPLPVSLITFTGTVLPNANQLQWTTAAEVNNAFFTLQHSPDGAQFTTLAQLTGAGNSSMAKNYEHLDTNPYPLTYYRLMQTDFDGSTRQAGNVITLVRPQTTGSFAFTHIIPTPTQHTATLTYTTPNTQPITLHLYDLTGRLLQHETLQATIGTNNHVLDMTKYPNGLYVVTLNNGVEVVSGKVVKE